VEKVVTSRKRSPAGDSFEANPCLDSTAHGALFFHPIIIASCPYRAYNGMLLTAVSGLWIETGGTEATRKTNWRERVRSRGMKDRFSLERWLGPAIQPHSSRHWERIRTSAEQVSTELK